MIGEQYCQRNFLFPLMQTTRTIEKGREVDVRGSMPWGGAVMSKDVPFAIDAKGGEKLWTGGDCSQGEPECCHQWQRGRLLIRLSLMPTMSGHWCQQLSLGVPCGAPEGCIWFVVVCVRGDLLTLSKPKLEAPGALGTIAKALNFLENGQVN